MLENGITTSYCCLREEISHRAVSPPSTQKNPNNRVLPSTCFPKLPNFDSAAPAAAEADGAGRGRLAGQAALAPSRNAYTARAGPPSGTGAQLPLQPSSPARYKTQAYRATLKRTLRLPASSHGNRARSRWALEPPPAARVPPAPLLAGPAGERPPQDTAPQPRAAPARRSSPRRARRRRSSPRTHSPRQPRAPQRPVSSCRCYAPGPSPSPSGPPWACRDLEFGAGPRAAGGAAVRPLPAELRGAPAVFGALLRSGRTAKAAP